MCEALAKEGSAEARAARGRDRARRRRTEVAPGGRSVHLALQAADADRRHKQGGRADAQRGCKSQFDIIKSQFLNITRCLKYFENSSKCGYH